MKRLLWIVLVFALLALPVLAQDSIPEGEGGAIRITGTGTYTFFGVDLIYDEPVVVLLDATTAITRNYTEDLGTQGQVLGYLTSDFFESPFTYQINLPFEPTARLNDVDQDGETDAGVQVYYLTIGQNFIDDSYLSVLEAGALINSVEFDSLTYELTEGTLLIWSPDAEQGFPSGFGEDGLIFTEDDPIVTLPQGYTIVTLGEDEFTFSRARDGVIDVTEAEIAEEVDFSEMGYVESFNALIDLLIARYAYTEYRQIDWEAVRAEYLPRIEQAEADEDALAFALAISELALNVRDAHVSSLPQEGDIQSFLLALIEPVAAGVGAELTELDDGRVIVTSVAEGSPAEAAGFVWGTEIIALDDTPVAEAIDAEPLIPALGTAGTPHNGRLNQVATLLYTTAGGKIEVTYRNPGEDEQTVSLNADPNFGYLNVLIEQFQAAGIQMAMEYRTEGDYGYVRFPSFTRTSVSLTIWEDFIRTLNQNNVDGMIIDMRGNMGGSLQMSAIMASYLYTQENPFLSDTVYYTYDPDTNGFVLPLDVDYPVYAPNEDVAFEEPVVILVDQACASACEFFSYDLQASGRAVVIGQYPSSGAGGNVNQLNMPEGVIFSYTYTRALLPDESAPIIEGIGVVPDVLVPVTEETERLKAEDGDPVLDAAIAYLDEQ